MIIIRSCIEDCSEKGKESSIIEIKSVNNVKNCEIDKSFLEAFLEKYPQLFKICCFCLIRRRKSVGNHCDSSNNIEDVFKIHNYNQNLKDLDNINNEFTTLEK